DRLPVGDGRREATRHLAAGEKEPGAVGVVAGVVLDEQRGGAGVIAPGERAVGVEHLHGDRAEVVPRPGRRHGGGDVQVRRAVLDDERVGGGRVVCRGGGEEGGGRGRGAGGGGGGAGGGGAGARGGPRRGGGAAPGERRGRR